MENETIKILNIFQAMFYVDNGVQPLRVEHGHGDRMVFVFSKADTFDLYGEWIKKCKAHKNQFDLRN